MKKTIASALIAFTALSGAAVAATPSDSTVSQIQRFAPNADLSGLTQIEAQRILSIIHGGDNDGQKRSRVAAALS